MEPDAPVSSAGPTEQTPAPAAEDPQALAAARAAARNAALAELEGGDEPAAAAESAPSAPAAPAEPAPEPAAEPEAEAGSEAGQSYWRELAQLRREKRELQKQLQQKGQEGLSLEALRQYDPAQLARALNWDDTTLINVLTSRTGSSPAPAESTGQAPEALSREQINQLVQQAVQQAVQPLQRQLSIGQLAQVVAQRPEQYEMILQAPADNLQLVLDTANELGRPANDPELLQYIEDLLVDHQQKQLERMRSAKKLQRYFTPQPPPTATPAPPAAKPAPAPAIAGPNGESPTPRALTNAELRDQCLDILVSE
jgi:hypothetical protein